MPQATQVRAAYDDRNIYFAFHCVDPEPDKVRSTLSRRDNMWNDDWVGLSLDSVGNGQSSYDLFVNPHGVQGDILTTPERGREHRARLRLGQRRAAARPRATTSRCACRSPASASRAAATSSMGILFWRRVSRLGHVGLVARGARGQELHRAPRADGAPRPEAAAHAGGDPERHLLAAADARHARRLRRGRLGSRRRASR